MKTWWRSLSLPRQTRALGLIRGTTYVLMLGVLIIVWAFL